MAIQKNSNETWPLFSIIFGKTILTKWLIRYGKRSMTLHNSKRRHFFVWMSSFSPLNIELVSRSLSVADFSLRWFVCLPLCPKCMRCYVLPPNNNNKRSHKILEYTARALLTLAKLVTLFNLLCDIQSHSWTAD